mgnify:FL=1
MDENTRKYQEPDHKLHPLDRLHGWRAWAATVTKMDLMTATDDDLQRSVGDRLETLRGLVDEYRKARQADLDAELRR